MMKHRITWLVLLALLVSVIPLSTSAQAVPDTIVLAFTRQPDSLFVDYAATATASYAMAVLYNSLVEIDSSGNAVPELAESWEISEDQRTFTFTLRQDVLWHDGEPFTAEDVAFTYTYSASPDYTGSAYDANILGAAAVKAGEADAVEGIEVIDEYTIAITTEEPNALFLNTIGGRFIMPEHVLGEIPIAELGTSVQNSAPIGTGPYRLVEWSRDEAITFQAFDDYFGGRANITNYIWRIIPEATVHITELLNGQVDIVPEVPAEDFLALNPRPVSSRSRLPGVNMVTIMINTDDPLFADARVRQAVSTAIDRESIIAVASAGLGDAVVSQIHPSLPEYNASLTGQAFDVEAARALLAEVGWTDGDGDGILEANGVDGVEDGTPFSFSLGTPPQPLYSLPAQVIQQNLAAVGIEATLNTVDFNIYFSEFLTTNNPDFQAGMSGWFNLLFPPQVELASNYASYGASNYRHNWENEEFDELLLQAPTVFDSAERSALYMRAQEILGSELPQIYLICPNNLVAANANLVLPELSSLNQLFQSVALWSWTE
jgi:peptide/nickel transport system substrate-binding protein